MKWPQVEKRLRAIGFIEGERTKHHKIMLCPCPNHEHSVGVENHPTKEAYIFDYKRKLGPHLKDFGKC